VKWTASQLATATGQTSAADSRQLYDASLTCDICIRTLQSSKGAANQTRNDGERGVGRRSGHWERDRDCHEGAAENADPVVDGGIVSVDNVSDERGSDAGETGIPVAEVATPSTSNPPPAMDESVSDV
jgi:hypothetical protein